MNKYIIYARENCAFCKKLLNYMKENNERFVYTLVYNLDEDLRSIMEKYKWRTVPIVLELEDGNATGKLIGGCDDTIQHIKRKRTRDDSVSDS